MEPLTDTADALIAEAPLSGADKLRLRLWLALIDGFTDNAHVDTAWQIARAIDTHWRGHAEQMYAAGFTDGLTEAERRAAAATLGDEHLKELERKLLMDPPDRLH